MKLALGILCAALCLCCLWGCSYALHLLSQDDWRLLPITLSMILGTFVSLFGAMFFLTEWAAK